MSEIHFRVKNVCQSLDASHGTLGPIVTTQWDSSPNPWGLLAVSLSEISRLARRTAVAAEFIDVCIEDQEILIYIVDDMIDTIDPDNPMSSFFAKQLALWYEEERRQIVRRIKSGIKQAQRSGK